MPRSHLDSERRQRRIPLLPTEHELLDLQLRRRSSAEKTPAARDVIQLERATRRPQRLEPVRRTNEKIRRAHLPIRLLDHATLQREIERHIACPELRQVVRNP